MPIFSSLKILDLTRVFSGPFATRHFAELGAEVIKIESPSGDDSRYFPPIKNGASGYFEILNHNKKSIVLDLKNSSDLQKFYELCLDADVVVENFSADVKKRLKIDYDTLQKINPKIIYASISGISENVSRKYYDVIAQAESGLISLNGENEDMKNATSVVDAFAGMKLAFALAAALYQREKTNQGSRLNVSMKGAAFDLLEQNLVEASVIKTNPKKVGNMDNAIAPFGVFKTKDGSIVLAVGNDNLWNVLVGFLAEHSEDFDNNLFLSNQLRLKNLLQLKQTIEKVFGKFTSFDLPKKLNSLGVPCGQVKKMLDVIEDQENFEQNLLQKTDHPDLGEIVVATGGIFFANSAPVPYKISPKLNENKDEIS